jgi:hypothetical protein
MFAHTVLLEIEPVVAQTVVAETAIAETVIAETVIVVPTRITIYSPHC